jgi:hypothetical protein
MSELTFSEPVTLEEDAFNKHVKRSFYQMNTGEVDQDMLRQQIKAHAENQKQSMPDIDDAMMAKLLDHASCDIFPIQVPTKDGGYFAVSLYCDDKGMAKGLEANTRATGLVHACGYPDQTIRGDAFIGRIFDDEDAWYRCDFTLTDMRSDAPWVVLTKSLKQRPASSLANLTAQMAKNPAIVAPGVNAPLQDASMEDTEESQTYRWRQEAEDVEITATLPAGTVRKDIKVNVQALSLKVQVKGDLFFGGKLGGPVEADESTWTLGTDPDGSPHIQITLPKQRALQWQRCLTV